MQFLRLAVLTAFLSSTYSATFAQTAFGVRAGLNLSKMFIKDEFHSYSESYKLSPGVLAGLVVEFPTKRENFNIQAAAQFVTKGYRIDERRSLVVNGPSYDYFEKMSLHYLEVPVHMKFSFPTRKLRFYLLTGGYFGLGLSGKVRAQAEYRGKEFKSEAKVPWGSDPQEDLFKKPDYGFSAGAGVHKGRFVFGFNAQYGIANIASYQKRETVARNMGMCFFMEYRLTEHR
ncbi:MAG: porin family protein [Owenweeksia sp.]